MTNSRHLLPMPAVLPSSRVSVLSPASFAKDDRMTLGMERLRALGFLPQAETHTQTRGPLYFAARPADRLDDLHAAFENSAVAWIVAVRGGYGSNYLLDGLDAEMLRRNPKPFFAYSDLTGVQLHLLDCIGLPAFHGPMVAADFYLDDGVHLESFRAALAGVPYTVGAAEGLRTLKPGNARGTLYGGCLSIIVALLGTRWEPHTEGTLLFLEDTGVKPYQIDRMLWQLRHAGKLNGVRGIIFGEMLACATFGAEDPLPEVAILHALDGLAIPIALGLRSGHVSRQNVTLTFGVEAELRAGTQAELHLLEPAVRA